MPTLKQLKRNYPQKNDKREERQEIYRSPEWKKLRKLFIQHNPLCQECLKEDIITPAIDVHHIDSFMNYEGLERLSVAYDINNLQALCKQCHQKKHNG